MTILDDAAERLIEAMKEHGVSMEPGCFMEMLAAARIASTSLIEDYLPQAHAQIFTRAELRIYLENYTRDLMAMQTEMYEVVQRRHDDDQNQSEYKDRG